MRRRVAEKLSPLQRPNRPVEASRPSRVEAHPRLTRPQRLPRRLAPRPAHVSPVVGRGKIKAPLKPPSPRRLKLRRRSPLLDDGSPAKIAQPKRLPLRHLQRLLPVSLGGETETKVLPKLLWRHRLKLLSVSPDKEIGRAAPLKLLLLNRLPHRADARTEIIRAAQVRRLRRRRLLGATEHVDAG